MAIAQFSRGELNQSNIQGLVNRNARRAYTYMAGDTLYCLQGEPITVDEGSIYIKDYVTREQVKEIIREYLEAEGVSKSEFEMERKSRRDLENRFEIIDLVEELGL